MCLQEVVECVHHIWKHTPNATGQKRQGIASPHLKLLKTTYFSICDVIMALQINPSPQWVIRGHGSTSSICMVMPVYGPACRASSWLRLLTSSKISTVHTPPMIGSLWLQWSALLWLPMWTTQMHGDEPGSFILPYFFFSITFSTLLIHHHTPCHCDLPCELLCLLAHNTCLCSIRLALLIWWTHDLWFTCFTFLYLIYPTHPHHSSTNHESLCHVVRHLLYLHFRWTLCLLIICI